MLIRILKPLVTAPHGLPIEHSPGALIEWADDADARRMIEHGVAEAVEEGEQVGRAAKPRGE
jgi:hypothetical protein